MLDSAPAAGSSGVDGDEWASLDLREAGRFVANEARANQEAAWAGTNVDSRQIWGAREAQRIYGQRLRLAVQDLFLVRTLAAGLTQPASTLGRWLIPALLARVLEFEATGRGACLEFAAAWRRVVPLPGQPGDLPAGRALEVCVRKRPLLQLEALAGEWDAVELLQRDASVLCHDGRLSRSGRQLVMTHRHFTLDRAWGTTTSTEAVYQDVVLPRLRGSLAGCGSTLLCMGQTGTGKTYTICGIAKCLARDLRAAGSSVSVDFFEIYGKKCLDLLANRKEVHLRSDEEGRVHLCGQRIVSLAGGEGLAEAIEVAMSLRAAEETERNSASSRSHAICTLRVGSNGGVLRLVDLAGSERNFETTKMTAQQHRESADINSSLMVLKDCFRAHAARQRGEDVMMPFRGSQLTRVLRDCFVNPSHSTAVIATISPAAADVIHTINTLMHATMLAKPLADLASHTTVDLPLHLKGSGSFRDVPLMEWTPEDVLAWLQEAENGRFAHVVVPPNLDGRRLLSTSSQGLSDLFEGALRRARVDHEGEAWTVQVDNVGEDLGRALFAAARRAAA